MPSPSLSECLRTWYERHKEAPSPEDMRHFADCVAELERAAQKPRKRQNRKKEGV